MSLFKTTLYLAADEASQKFNIERRVVLDHLFRSGHNQTWCLIFVHVLALQAFTRVT